MKRFLITLMISLIISSSFTPISEARTDDNKFVRTASYFLLSSTALEGDNVETLASFDLIVIPVEAQVYNQAFFKQARLLNPDIIILPYIATVSWNDLYWIDPLHQKLYAGIQNNWWLNDGNGNQQSVWPGTRALNLNSGWKSYLTEFVNDEVLASGLWDGVFYDEVQDSISWIGSVDVDKDGNNDSASTADALWAERYKELFAETRNLIGPDNIMISNGSSNKAFAPYVNGRMFETFPSSESTISRWSDLTDEYLEVQNEVRYEPINVLNVNTENTGEKNNFQRMRFGITTTLLGNGYFGFDYGTENHSQLWTYDEYDVYLGAPKTNLQNVFNPQQTTISSGVWQRDFEQGKVLVNATTTEQTIELDGDYEKLHGTQDTYINDGSIVSEITLESKDGVILLRPIEQINDSTFFNGSFARIFNINGQTRRTGFFAYNNSQRGGMQIIHFDSDQDGARELIAADDTYVYIYEETGELHAKFAPYTENYNQGINISVGDIENDGSVEIVTGTENGGGPHVRVFDKDGTLINPGFFAYADSFRGGANVTIGDLNGDNIKEIIVGAGFGGGPHVRVFKKDGTLINPGFFAYDKSFRGGVNVATADVDGDGIDDIVTGPGLGGAPIARVYDRDGNLKSEFTIFDANNRSGLEVAATDIDGDGIAEIIGLTTDVFTLSAF